MNNFTDGTCICTKSTMLYIHPLLPSAVTDVLKTLQERTWTLWGGHFQVRLAVDKMIKFLLFTVI